MFGVGFNELLLILGVALLVLGPDKLPELAHFLGKSLADIKRATDDVTKSFMADTGLKETADSLKKSILSDPSIKETAESLKRGFTQAAMPNTDLKKMFEDIKQGIPQTMGGLTSPVKEAAQAAQATLAAASGAISTTNPESEPVTVAAAPTPAPEAKPAIAKRPTAKFADDDTE